MKVSKALIHTIMHTSEFKSCPFRIKILNQLIGPEVNVVNLENIPPTSSSLAGQNNS